MTDALTRKWQEKLTQHKAIWRFEEGTAEMRRLLGGKGANLAEMTRLGVPVPPGFTITTEVCNLTSEFGGALPPGLEDEIRAEMVRLEEKMGKGFGDPENPLLVSVRSGAPISMPGMMDTVLNLGLTSRTVGGLVKQSGDERFAYDAYRRFIQMFADVVLELPRHRFEEMLADKKGAAGVQEDWQLPAEALKALVDDYRGAVREALARPFPDDAYEQLFMAVQAVFRSWNNPRARVYRKKERIPDDLGTAVNVQSMVFGNMGSDSGTGVAFTRDPNTGEKRLVGDFLVNAQGEDVVAGIRNPQSIEALREMMPGVYEQLSGIASRLEKHYRDLQDMEFTVERGRLFLLQTRSGKRSAAAAVRVAVDMVEEGLIDRGTAVSRIRPAQLDRLLHPFIPPQVRQEAVEEGRLIARGTGASPGAARGMVIFDAAEAARLGAEGRELILVRPETTPDDAHGMAVARGILTSTGGPSSHAALVARGWGIPCVVGCEALRIDLAGEVVRVGDLTLRKGDRITIDGTTGEVLLGDLALEEPTELSEETRRLLEWADGFRRLGVYANADTPRDAARARQLGATGIGLCRTEHMFMEADRLPLVQRMIMVAPRAEYLRRLQERIQREHDALPEGPRRVEAARRLAEHRRKLERLWREYTEVLDRLRPIQRDDFRGILKAMAGCWVIVRLLDPPLHEFLPDYDQLLVDLTRLRTLREAGNEKAYAAALQEIRDRRREPDLEQGDLERLLEQLQAMREANPMLGLRVCRLGIVYPEIYKMQVRALFEAACSLVKEGVDARPEVMVPGVGTVEEMRALRETIAAVAEQVIREHEVELAYKIGTMIEIPRATCVAEPLARYAEFFSFGTNDLTQTTYGYSRDDAAGTFLPVYLESGILPADPFQVVDREGVGRLMRLAVEEGRRGRPDLEVGICGEHGGDPESVEFCHQLGLDYVSCSPFRVPIARLAAAHAALRERG